MSLGFMTMALGAFVFIPAVEARTFWVFLTGILIQGVGMTILQTAANSYIMILGPIESGAKRLSIMGIANKNGRSFRVFNVWRFITFWHR
jgi:FHS family L-fucose permease-like MFS transporter